MRIRLWLLIVVSLSTYAVADPPRVINRDPSQSNVSRTSDAVERGLRWLTRQQGEDGGWRSETYGSLREGVGITALVVYALAEIPSDETRKAYEEGIEFLTSQLDRQGFVQSPSGLSDNQILATALTLSALSRRPVAEKSQEMRDMTAALLSCQHGRGASTSVDAGGWSPSMDPQGEPSQEMPANLWVTSFVLEALGHTQLSPAARSDATSFLRHCQTSQPAAPSDGGFCFTPEPDHPLNKLGSALDADGRRRALPYFSTTCDGYVAITRLGISDDDSRRSTARRWIARQALPVLRQPESLSEDAPPEPLDGLFFYSAAAFARVWRSESNRQDLDAQRTRLFEVLRTRQNADGSWSNPVASMREDDPLIATSFAILACTVLDD